MAERDGAPVPRRGLMAEYVPRLDALEGWPPPEAQPSWHGAPAAETALLDAYRGGRMHHAWLLGGTKGIGKATLAYRFARFALAHPDPASPAVGAAVDLSVPEDSPAFRRVAGMWKVFTRYEKQMSAIALVAVKQ